MWNKTFIKLLHGTYIPDALQNVEGLLRLVMRSGEVQNSLLRSI